jgi:RecA-family ATPase
MDEQMARELESRKAHWRPNGAALHARDGTPLGMINPTTWQGKPVPERRWIVPHWIPQGYVTGLYGLGGVGKSLLAQQLMTSVALGRPWLGLPTPSVRALGVFCEDDEDELHRRQEDINRVYGCEFEDLESMRLVSRLGSNNLFMTFEGGQPHLTPFFYQVLEEAEAFGARLLIVDTVADTFGGNENDRAQARQYVQAALGHIARAIDGAVLACAHPSQAGINSGTGESGSTGWDASFRSRLYLAKPKTEEGEAPDPDARVLARKKANYAARDESIPIRWKDGVFITEREPSGMMGSIQRRAVETVFLDLLDAFARQDRPVSANSRAGNYAPKLFAMHADRDGFKKGDFARAMETLFARGEITNARYGRSGDERKMIVRVAPTKGAADAAE